MADTPKNSFEESAEALAKVKNLVLKGEELQSKVQSLVDEFDKGRESVAQAVATLGVTSEELKTTQEEVLGKLDKTLGAAAKKATLAVGNAREELSLAKKELLKQHQEIGHELTAVHSGMTSLRSEVVSTQNQIFSAIKKMTDAENKAEQTLKRFEGLLESQARVAKKNQVTLVLLLLVSIGIAGFAVYKLLN